MARTKSELAPISTQDVGFLLAKASQRVNELLAARFAAEGFPDVRASHGSVLVPLFERDGRRVGELAAASRLSKQAMTGLLGQCEAAGLVERQPDPIDGRAFSVQLTERGRGFQRVAEDVLGELDAQLARQLGTETRDALTRALKGVIDL